MKVHLPAWAAGLAFAVWMLTGIAHAQNLTITSPRSGAVVYAGEKITVIVEAKPEGAFRGGGVVIIGGDPIGMSDEVLSGPPFRFSLQIPTNTTPREYGLTADGFTTPGHGFNSKMVTIEVERPDRPARIIVSRTPVGWPLPVQNSPIVIPAVRAEEMLGYVTGIFGNVEVDLTESTHVRYSTDNPRVATIKERGLVTGTGIGSARITVTYNGCSTAVPVTVEQRLSQMVVRP